MKFLKLIFIITLIASLAIAINIKESTNQDDADFRNRHEERSVEILNEIRRGEGHLSSNLGVLQEHLDIADLTLEEIGTTVVEINSFN